MNYMQYKYKVILAISQQLNIPLEDIQHYAHWYKNIGSLKYDFINGFSFELENDVKTFIAKSYLTQDKKYVSDLELKDKFTIQDIRNKKEFTPIQLNKKIYERDEILFTIGYEGLSIDGYINKLLENGIKTVVDVRRNAFSNKFGFTKKEFQYCLEKSGIKYIHIPELGIESEKRKEVKKDLDFGLFANGKSVVKEMFEEYKLSLSSKKLYIDKLLNVSKKDKMVAITCFEASYKDCHRGVLAGFLKDVEIINI